MKMMVKNTPHQSDALPPIIKSLGNVEMQNGFKKIPRRHMQKGRFNFLEAHKVAPEDQGATDWATTRDVTSF